MYKNYITCVKHMKSILQLPDTGCLGVVVVAVGVEVGDGVVGL